MYLTLQSERWSLHRGFGHFELYSYQILNRVFKNRFFHKSFSPHAANLALRPQHWMNWMKFSANSGVGIYILIYSLTENFIVLWIKAYTNI